MLSVERLQYEQRLRERLSREVRLSQSRRDLVDCQGTYDEGAQATGVRIVFGGRRRERDCLSTDRKRLLELSAIAQPESAPHQPCGAQIIPLALPP